MTAREGTTRRRLLAAATLAAAMLASAQGAPATAAAAERVAVSTGEFGNPHDVVLGPDGRRLFVADVDNDAVKVLDAETLETVGAIGAGELDSPHDVAFDGEGRLLVADSGNDRVAMFRVEGTRGTLVGTIDKGLRNPEGVAALAPGRILVADTLGGALVLFEDGREIRRQERPPGMPGPGYARPHDVALDREGRIVLVDSSNNRVVTLDRDWSPVRVLAEADHGFREPKYVAFDAANNLYLADEWNDRVRVFDAGGREIDTIGDDPGEELNMPEGVEVRGERVWIADTSNHRIVLFER